MAFKEKVMKCIVEMGEEKTVQEISGGIAVKAAKILDENIKQYQEELSKNMKGFAEEVEKAKQEIKEMVKDGNKKHIKRIVQRSENRP